MKNKINKNLYFYINKPIFISLFFFYFLFIFNITNVSAVTLNKDVYDYGEDILYVDNVGATMYFDVNSDTANLLGSEHEAGFNINEGGAVFDNGNYVIMEHQSGDNDCYWNDSPTEPYTSKLEECRNSPELINEFTFTVRDRPSGGGGDEEPELDEELTPVNMGTMLYSPEVSIFSILKGSFFADKLNIKYKATDQNDLGSYKEQFNYGLIENPVTISYSDKASEYFTSFNDSDKIQIAKDQPAEGDYVWSVKELKQGVLYRIIVEAVDRINMWGQVVSEFFGVDFSAPVFTVKVNPQAVRSGEVTISVDSSEDLSKIPEVKVIQNGGTPQTVVMKGEKSYFEGVYKVLSGFDGPASVKVSGYDVANNLSTEIVSGGTFSVGVNPPPKPNIVNYKEKIVTDKEFIDFSGSVRADTEVLILVNGIQISRIKPDTKGSFTFSQIKLDKEKNNGRNYIDIVSIDQLGTQSQSSLTEVKYNIPPTVIILNPKEKETVSNIYNINVEGKDDNNDILFYTYQILALSKFKNNIFDWITVGDSIPSKSYSFNTTELEDGNYVLQVKANDKNVETVSTPVVFTVKNVLPAFTFVDGRSTITNKSNVMVKGKASTSINLSPRPSIVSVAYSMDKGITWAPAKIENIKGSYEKSFSVEFVDLKEGTYPVLWRTKDTRDFIGLIVHPIIVDKTAPKAPSVISPRLEISKDLVINNSNDENVDKDGIQINIKGKTEALNIVSLIYNGQTVTTKALVTGDFTLKDVSFDKKGRYNFELFATDLASNIGSKTSFSVLYNNPPVISFINPKAFRGVSSNTNISWSIKDSDGDSLRDVLVSYRNKDKDTLFKTLVSGANTIGNYNWNTSSLPESNNYELKISVNDGYGSSSSVESFSVDRTIPVLNSFVFDKNTIDEKTKKSSFVAKGEATDNLSGVEYIEYSLESSDGVQTPWYKGVITSGYLKNKANYQIKHPLVQEDGGYKIYARAVDTSGNTSEPLELSTLLDETSPRVGGFFLGKGGVDFKPDVNGNISIYENNIFKFNISLEKDTKSASVKIGDKNYELKKDVRSQLWVSDISIQGENSNYKIYITALDNSGNMLDNREIGGISLSMYDSSNDLTEKSSEISIFKKWINKLLDLFK